MKRCPRLMMTEALLKERHFFLKAAQDLLNQARDFRRPMTEAELLAFSQCLKMVADCNDELRRLEAKALASLELSGNGWLSADAVRRMEESFKPAEVETTQTPTPAKQPPAKCWGSLRVNGGGLHVVLDLMVQVDSVTIEPTYRRVVRRFPFLEGDWMAEVVSKCCQNGASHLYYDPWDLGRAEELARRAGVKMIAVRGGRLPLIDVDATPAHAQGEGGGEKLSP